MEKLPENVLRIMAAVRKNEEMLKYALRRADVDFAEAGWHENSDIRSVIRCALARATGDYSEESHWMDAFERKFRS
jgi:hypothetical protein